MKILRSEIQQNLQPEQISMTHLQKTLPLPMLDSAILLVLKSRTNGSHIQTRL